MLTVRDKNRTMTTARKPRKRTTGQDLLLEVARPMAQWGGRQLADALRGIVSAYRSSGGSKQEVAAAVAPLAKSLQVTGKAPKFQNVEGGIKFTHTESLPLIDGHQGYNISSDSLNWLRPIANSFEEYRIKCEFGIVPVCPATTTGMTMLAFDYDPVDIGFYSSAQDYFNTSDHCVTAAWSPCAISPKQSAWLKTGTTGESRLWSPGNLKAYVTSKDNGFLMVRYTVELRKTQPNSVDAYAIYTGTYTAAANIFTNPTFVTGTDGIISITPTSLTLLKEGNYIVVWSTDKAGGVGTITVGGSGGYFLGGYNGSTRSTIAWNGYTPGNIMAAVTGSAPGGPTAWKLVVTKCQVAVVY